MSAYDRNPLLVIGEGSFTCPNCGRVLLLRHKGNKYELKFKCSRCNSQVTMKCVEPIPILFERDKFIISSIRNLLIAMEKEEPLHKKVRVALENVINQVNSS